MKTPKPRQLKSGVWYIQLRLGGQTVIVHGKKDTECTKKAEKIKADYRNGLLLQQGSDVTMRQAIDNYIDLRSNVLSPATIRGYRSMQRNRFQSVMDLPLAKVKDWQKLINTEAAHLSPKTVRNAWGLVTPILRDNDIPTPNVTLPQIIPTDHPFLEPEQIPVFLDVIRGHPCEMAAVLGLHGLRRSELLALQKSDVDLKKKTIRIHGAMVPDENEKFVRKETNKNTTSTRTIPIMIPRLIELVSAAADGPLVTVGYINLYRSINRVCHNHDLPAVGLHGLRHSFASLAYHLGLSQRETMELGGWADPGTMNKIYTHLAQRDRVKAGNAMSEWFSKL